MRFALIAFVLSAFSAPAIAATPAAPCVPTKSYAQAKADFDAEVALALADYQEEVAAARAVYEAEVAEATAWRDAELARHTGDNSADELNRVMVRYDQLVAFSAARFNENVRAALAGYDMRAARAVHNYDRALCRK